MGAFDFDVDKEFMKTLGRLADVDKVAPQMIKEALPTCTEKLRTAIGEKNHPYATGEMLASIKEGKPSQLHNGGWRGISRPTGKSSDGKVRNMEKLVYMEYGTSHQAAVHVMDRARNLAKGPAEAKMEEVFRREMKLK